MYRVRPDTIKREKIKMGTPTLEVSRKNRAVQLQGKHPVFDRVSLDVVLNDESLSSSIK